MLLYRAGESSLHRGPDGLSRDAEGRDLLILARDSESTGYRARISGVVQSIIRGEGDDEAAEALTIEKIEREHPERLKPLPPEQGLSVSLNYERKQNHKPKKTDRGENLEEHGREINRDQVQTVSSEEKGAIELDIVSEKAQGSARARAQLVAPSLGNKKKYHSVLEPINDA